MKLSEIEQVLRESIFFKDLDDRVIRKIASLGEVVTLKGGEHIFTH